MTGVRKFFVCRYWNFHLTAFPTDFGQTIGYGGAQTFISNRAGRENGPKMTPFDLLSSVHVFQRNPVGHSRRTCNVGPAMASSPRSREIFGPF
jgi:hypothetical protein